MRRLCGFVLLLVVSFVIPSVAGDCTGAFLQRGQVLTVAPNGVEDTRNLQCAFVAAENKPGITVQLLSGTYITGPILANDFYGKLRGAGIGKTIIRNPDSPVFVMADIGCSTWDHDCLPITPTINNPYPSMFTFLNGDFEVSDVSVRVNGTEPTTGWNMMGVEMKGFQFAFLVDGQTKNGSKSANATFRRVEVVGVPSADYFSNNVWMPICYGGWFNYQPLSGKFTVTDSNFKGTGTSTTVQNVSNSRVLITHNTYDTHLYGPDISDAKDTSYIFSQNTVKGAGLAAWVGASGCDLLLGNCGISNSTLMFVGNSFVADSGMYIDGPMDANSSCMVTGNLLITPEPDIFFTASSQNCTAVLGRNDTFVDMGTFNRVTIVGRK